VDLADLTAAESIYIDCYEVLQDAPRRVLDTALEAHRDIVINLGGSPPPTRLAATLRGPAAHTGHDMSAAAVPVRLRQNEDDIIAFAEHSGPSLR
jgi:hypothetical protein